ncbi:MAG: DUF4417 domain-containing protein [Clostridia bacterium]|nr:DUF4417 domain-containing protein [Clostridia bacterium]
MSNKIIRSGCKDVWNAFMAEGAQFCEYDIPFCPTTATNLPSDIITWEEAQHIYSQSMKAKRKDFKVDAFVCFYIDDEKFDKSYYQSNIWVYPKRALKILRHFSGIITPDYSTYQDFPEAIKIYATYRMRLLGYWFGQNGINVINNVRWGSSETYRYCFLGIPQHSIVAIGTVGGSPKKIVDRKRFECGLIKMIDTLHPHTIIVYGSANYPCFNVLKSSGIRILSFKGSTAKYFEGGKRNE